MGAVSIVACDVDLNRIHAFSATEGRVCYNSPTWPLEVLQRHDVVLVEVASPVQTGGSGAKGAAQAYNRRKWAIGNSFEVGRLAALAEPLGFLSRILVSPANLWTGSHPESVREAIAGCAGQDNHDIRACRCMIHFYNLTPKHWVPLTQYYPNLSKKGNKTK